MYLIFSFFFKKKLLPNRLFGGSCQCLELLRHGELSSWWASDSSRSCKTSDEEQKQNWMPGIWCWNGENSRARESFLLVACSPCLWLCRDSQQGSGGRLGAEVDEWPPLAPCARTGMLLPASLCPWEGEGSLWPKPCCALSWHSKSHLDFRSVTPK